MANVTGSFETVAAPNAGLIRKALKGTFLLGKYGTAPLVTSLVATGGQIQIADTYESLGWISEDGLTFSRNRDFSEVRGWGSGTVLRRDVSSDDRTVQFAALEDKRLTHELRESLDLADVEMSAAGEFKYELLAKPDIMYWRGVAIGVDGEGSSRFYVAKVFHKLTVSDMDDEAWTDGDDPLTFNVTMTAQPDDVTGTLGTEFIFGPGALARADAMGITVASS